LFFLFLKSIGKQVFKPFLGKKNPEKESFAAQKNSLLILSTGAGFLSTKCTIITEQFFAIANCRGVFQ